MYVEIVPLWLKNSTICSKHTLLIHSSVVVYMGWFHKLSVVSSAAINVDVQVSLWFVDLASSG